jgi:hypothetical protein
MTKVQRFNLNHASLSRFEVSFGVVTSVIFFQIIVGLSKLNPTSTDWLLGGDAASNYLGWEFFRSSSLFNFPLGLSPNFGVGFSSSIVFTDSIPLIAIPLKFLLFAYHGPFQYFGFWLLFCFVLQGFFAQRITSRFSNSKTLRLVGPVLFLVSPIFLYRLTFDGFGHLALTGQFIVLWAMDAALSNNPRSRLWMVLAPVSVLIHFYLFAIVLSFFFAWFVFQFFSNRSKSSVLRILLRNGVFSGGMTLIAFYLAGGLIPNAATSSGFGVYRSSLTSLIDPQPSLDTSWSHVLGNVSDLPGSSEGFAFVGLASLLLIPFVGYGLKCVFQMRHLSLVSIILVSVALSLFALSPSISIAGRELFSYPVPNALTPVFSAFRSSGRFSWPVVYLILILAIIGIERLRVRNGIFVVLIPLLTVIQVWDSSTAIANTKERFEESNFVSVLTDPLWSEFAADYKHLVVIPPLNNDPNWIDFAALANSFKLTTNAAYVGRTDEAHIYELAGELQGLLERRKFDAKTLYVLTNYPPNPVADALVDLNGSPLAGGATITRLNGFVVIAP